VSRKRKKDEVDLLEGFDFDSILSGEIKGPEAFVPQIDSARLLPPSPEAQKPGESIGAESSTKVAPEPASKLRPNLDQSSIKVASNLGLSESIGAESSTKVAPEPASKLRPDLDQSSTKVAPKAHLEMLAGLQRNALIFIYESCLTTGSRVSPPIQIKNLAEVAKTTVAAARIAVQRLEQKGFVVRFEYKDGRGGWTKYEIPDQIYGQLLFRGSSIKVASNLDRSSIKVAPEPASEPAPNPPCSSSELNLNNITTTEPEFWLSVPKNLEGLVSLKQLREFARQGLIAPEELQTSLDGFALDLEKGLIKAKSGNPMAILIGAIKGGGYISQQYLTELKAALAEVERARVELAQLQAGKVAEELRREFENFRNQFPEEAERMKPHGNLINSFQPGSVGYRLWLEEYRRQKSDEPKDVAKPIEL
jgi:predicted transcriptional regulator